MVTFWFLSDTETLNLLYCMLVIICSVCQRENASCLLFLVWEKSAAVPRRRHCNTATPVGSWTNYTKLVLSVNTGVCDPLTSCSSPPQAEHASDPCRECSWTRTQMSHCEASSFTFSFLFIASSRQLGLWSIYSVAQHTCYKSDQPQICFHLLKCSAA